MDIIGVILESQKKLNESPVVDFGDRKSKGVLQDISLTPDRNKLKGPVTYNKLSNELTDLTSEYLFFFLKNIEKYLISKKDKELNKTSFESVVNKNIKTLETNLVKLLENNFDINKDDSNFINGNNKNSEWGVLKFDHIKSDTTNKSYSYTVSVNLNKLTKNKQKTLFNVLLSKGFVKEYGTSKLSVEFTNPRDRVLDISIIYSEI